MGCAQYKAGVARAHVVPGAAGLAKRATCPKPYIIYNSHFCLKAFETQKMG